MDILARGSFVDLHISVKELVNRIQDELGQRVFLFVPPESTKYLPVDAPPFGETVQSNFPEMAADIEDACWCLSVGRSTAAVYHLMRVMERGIERMAKRLKVPKDQVEDKTWGQILNAINDAIRKLSDRDSKEKRRKEKCAEASVHLNSVKIAWRNPTMHSRRRYTEEEAEAIFDNVKTFTSFLATTVVRR
jgi:hypothetical protein